MPGVIKLVPNPAESAVLMATDISDLTRSDMGIYHGLIFLTLEVGRPVFIDDLGRRLEKSDYLAGLQSLAAKGKIHIRSDVITIDVLDRKLAPAPEGYWIDHDARQNDIANLSRRDRIYYQELIDLTRRVGRPPPFHPVGLAKVTGLDRRGWKRRVRRLVRLGKLQVVDGQLNVRATWA